MVLGLRIDCRAFGFEYACEPFRGPGALGRIVDPRQRLQQDAAVLFRPGLAGKEAAAQILPVAAHAERGGAYAATEVEGEDLAAGIRSEEHTSELQSLMRNSY